LGILSARGTNRSKIYCKQNVLSSNWMKNKFRVLLSVTRYDKSMRYCSPLTLFKWLFFVFILCLVYPVFCSVSGLSIRDCPFGFRSMCLAQSLVFSVVFCRSMCLVQSFVFSVVFCRSMCLAQSLVFSVVFCRSMCLVQSFVFSVVFCRSMCLVQSSTKHYTEYKRLNKKQQSTKHYTEY
jgi:hypothetical protein